jgi:hypothetical protein
MTEHTRRCAPTWVLIGAAMLCVLAFVVASIAYGHSWSFGDVPTWIAVIGAVIGATLAGLQLQGQRGDIA